MKKCAAISNNYIPDAEFAQHLLVSQQHPVGISVLFYPRTKSTFTTNEFKIKPSGKKKKVKSKYFKTWSKVAVYPKHSKGGCYT